MLTLIKKRRNTLKTFSRRASLKAEVEHEAHTQNAQPVDKAHGPQSTEPEQRRPCTCILSVSILPRQSQAHAVYTRIMRLSLPDAPALHVRINNSPRDARPAKPGRPLDPGLH